MEDEIEIRKTRYKQMSTQELLDLHTEGILGDVAYKILENELRERGAIIPSRPKGEEPPAEANNTENLKEKPPCHYTILAWISPLIGLILLLASFMVENFLTFVGKNFLITAILLFLLSITVGVILTTWAFVERKRYSNALINGFIGLFVNVIFIILITMLVVYMSLWWVVPLK